MPNAKQIQTNNETNLKANHLNHSAWYVLITNIICVLYLLYFLQQQHQAMKEAICDNQAHYYLFKSNVCFLFFSFFSQEIEERKAKG